MSSSPSRRVFVARLRSWHNAALSERQRESALRGYLGLQLPNGLSRLA